MLFVLTLFLIADNNHVSAALSVRWTEVTFIQEDTGEAGSRLSAVESCSVFDLTAPSRHLKA